MATRSGKLLRSIGTRFEYGCVEKQLNILYNTATLCNHIQDLTSNNVGIVKLLFGTSYFTCQEVH